jgi:hypothetical protein
MSVVRVWKACEDPECECLQPVIGQGIGLFIGLVGVRCIVFHGCGYPSEYLRINGVWWGVIVNERL